MIEVDVGITKGMYKITRLKRIERKTNKKPMQNIHHENKRSANIFSIHHCGTECLFLVFLTGHDAQKRSRKLARIRTSNFKKF